MSLAQLQCLIDWATFGLVWMILADAEAGVRRAKKPIYSKHIPEKQLVRTCQVGRSTFGGLVSTWCSQIWYSLLHTGWARRKCEQLEHAGFKYLRSSSQHGKGLAAKIDIPENTELNYYIGTVYATAYNSVGNHSIEVGSCGRTNLCVNASRLPKNLLLG